MSQLPTTATAQSNTSEQSLSTVLHAEIMRDLDDGQLTLTAATETNLGDLREVSPARLRGMIADARAKLDQIERMAAEHEARDTLAAMLAEHGLHVQEWDTAGLDPKLRGRIGAVYDPTEGDGLVIVVPAGQDPIERLNAVSRLIARMERA